MGTGIRVIGTIGFFRCRCHFRVQARSATSQHDKRRCPSANDPLFRAVSHSRGPAPAADHCSGCHVGNSTPTPRLKPIIAWAKQTGWLMCSWFAGCARGRRRNSGRRSPVAGSAGLSLYAKGVWRARKSEIQNQELGCLAPHNVHAVPKTNSEFNFAQPIKGQVNESLLEARSSSAHQMRCASVDEHLRRRCRTNFLR